MNVRSKLRGLVAWVDDLAESGHRWTMRRWGSRITEAGDDVQLDALPARVATAARVLVNGRVQRYPRPRVSGVASARGATPRDDVDFTSSNTVVMRCDPPGDVR